ncbi:hypothetical protein WJX73_007318 [Symbiochloris irregularis]|uniref:Uncharacterized protein n=1 Tax=Symbiochloris irregularis TaxID=706552 RepID=A0AAW1NSU0_9CHLO
MVALCRADCPDADIRCRIPISDNANVESTMGCSLDGSGSVTADVPTVSISGHCYKTETDSDGTMFADIGEITIGQCFDAFQGGCQPDHCKNNAPGQRCNAGVKGCTVNEQGMCEGLKVSG